MTEEIVHIGIKEMPGWWEMSKKVFILKSPAFHVEIAGDFFFDTFELRLTNCAGAESAACKHRVRCWLPLTTRLAVTETTATSFLATQL